MTGREQLRRQLGRAQLAGRPGGLRPQESLDEYRQTKFAR